MIPIIATFILLGVSGAGSRSFTRSVPSAGAQPAGTPLAGAPPS